VAVFADAPKSVFPEEGSRTGPAHVPGADYLEGVVTAIAPGLAFVRDRWITRSDPVTLHIVPGTDICKGPCGWQPHLIRAGDRLEGPTRTLPDGTRTATWILLNVAAFTGDVDAVHSDHLVVQRHKHSCTQMIRILPASIVRVGDHEFAGTTSHFAVGDTVQVAGGATDPKSDAVVLATSVIKIMPTLEA
jgi:hypothetical protein